MDNEKGAVVAAASLKALLAKLIDYAGLYPPAALPLDRTLANYRGYLASPDSWILNRLVLPSSLLAGALAAEPGLHISLLVDGENGPFPPAVETLETRRPGRLSLPTYCEAPLDRVEGAFAKVRTGGVVPESIPSTRDLAAFLEQAAMRRVAFKATAGLHHPIRSLRPLTYAPASPRALMHGFVNVFAAASLAWHGAGRQTLTAVLEEEDPAAFRFSDDAMRWRDIRLAADQITDARRRFAHGFGSCSFEEPVAALRDFGWL